MNQFSTLPFQSKFSAFENKLDKSYLIQNMIFNNQSNYGENSKTDLNLPGLDSLQINQNYSSSSVNNDMLLGLGTQQEQKFMPINDFTSLLTAQSTSFKLTDNIEKSENGFLDVDHILEQYCFCNVNNQVYQSCEVQPWDPNQIEGMDYPKTYEEKEELYLKLLTGYKYETVSYYDYNKEKEITYYKCKYEDCDKELQKPWNLLDHVRMHEGVKPYLCQWCGKGFTQKGNLKKHARQHINPDVNDRKRYSCRFCGKGYTERYNLKVNICS